MSTIEEFAGAPGADLVRAGLDDLRSDRTTIEALLVAMASTRLRSLGLVVPVTAVERPSHRLYDLLAAEDARAAHSRFNALTRRLASFARTAEHARAR